jgi:hypothetical protein
VKRDEAHKALDSVGDAVTSQFSDEQGRLSQFSSVLASLKMVVDHLFDHAENAAASKEG